MMGKTIRMERIMDRVKGTIVIVPMDHGVTVGPVEGLTALKETVNAVAQGGANAVLMHKGVVAEGHRGGGEDIGLIIHLSAGTTLAQDPNCKVLVCTVEEAIKLGADAVSIHVNIGAPDEKTMLGDFGRVASSCLNWGMPLLAMVYPRGPKIKNPYDVTVVKHAARLGAELGADLVKVPYTGDPKSFHEVTQGCPVPVLIAGGEKMDTDEDVLAMVRGAMDAGGAGVSIGRNVFQHPDPRKMVEAISLLVHKGTSLKEALEVLL